MVGLTVRDWVLLALGLVSTFAVSWLFYWLTLPRARPGRSTRAGSRRLWAVLTLVAALAVTAFTVTAPGGSGGGAVRLEPAGSAVLAAGFQYSLAVAADGKVWTWGANEVSQLGDGTTTDRSTPLQVEGMNDVVAIASGFAHTLALRRDGIVWAWGGTALASSATGPRPAARPRSSCRG
jgi:hypothetical protein